MPFTPIVGTLAYLWDRSTDRVLMIRRDARPDDDHYGKVNGVGGKLEADEGITESLRREVREELGVELTALRLRGTITWTNFGPKREEWLGFVFLVTGWDGEPPTTNAEGSLEWVTRTRLLDACDDDETTRTAADLPMWEGDRHFVPLVFDDDPRAFHGTMPYDGDHPKSWDVRARLRAGWRRAPGRRAPGRQQPFWARSCPEMGENVPRTMFGSIE